RDKAAAGQIARQPFLIQRRTAGAVRQQYDRITAAALVNRSVLRGRTDLEPRLRRLDDQLVFDRIARCRVPREPAQRAWRVAVPVRPRRVLQNALPESNRRHDFTAPAVSPPTM